MKEIERKFLVHREQFPGSDNQTILKQGYLSVDPDREVRIRREGDRAWITIKGRMEGITRPEFDYTIPVEDAEALLGLALFLPVEKIRHRLVVDETHWEVNEFLGANAGLLMAEVELEDESQPFSRPAWLSHEVTFDQRYYNSELARKPYMQW